MFRIFIDKEVLEYIESLPFTTQAKCYFDLGGIMRCGLTARFAGDVTFQGKNRFSMKVFLEEQGEKLSTGMVLHGHYKKNRQGGADYFFAEAVGFLDNKVIHACWEKKLLKYKEIDQEWLKEKKVTEPIKQAFDDLPLASFYFNESRMNKNRFHKNLKSVRDYKQHHDQFGSGLDFNSQVAKADEVVSLENESLKAVIDRLKRKYDYPYILINFIDEHDDLYFAQTEFMIHTTYGLKECCPELNVLVIDVCINNEHNQKEFMAYFEKSPNFWGDEPRPFSMLIFRPNTKKEGVKYRKYKTLYFDMFDGCRGDDEQEHVLDRRFRRNRDVILHEMFAAACCASRQYMTRFVDLRKQSAEKTEHIIQTLAEDVVVVELSKDNTNAKNVLSWLPSGRGYPFFVIAWTNRNTDVVQFHKYIVHKLVTRAAPMDDRQEVVHQSETLYEHGVLSQLPGNQTIESFYALYNLQIPKFLKNYLQRYAHVPSVVGSTKKRSLTTA